MDERRRIARLARVFAEGGLPPGVEMGIGDDAAVLGGVPARARIVWTIDEQVEGTHFRRDWLSWRDLGWRSFMAAASDVAAMGAEPWCALSALVLSEAADDDAVEELTRGQHEAAAAIGARIVGGNLARGPAVSIATTMLGTCDRAVSRAGAQPGDGVWLAGAVGLAAAGLRALAREEAHVQKPNRAHMRAEGDADPLEPLWPAIEAWRRPRALVDAGRSMGAVARAAIDVSDGLARDAGHVADASGVQIVFDADAILATPGLRQAAAALDADPLELALHGGEDYALVAASSQPVRGFRRVGEVRPGCGLTLRSSNGAERTIAPEGFDHFR